MAVNLRAVASLPRARYLRSASRSGTLLPDTAGVQTLSEVLTMKFSINCLNEVSLEFTLALGSAGWDVEGVFPVFLGRPGRPHLSLFSKPNGSRFTPHGTAWRGTPNESRVWLPKFTPEAADEWNTEAGAAVHRAYVESLVPVDLERAAQDGWTAHWVDWRALTRWARPACRPGGTLAITAEVLDSLCLHVLRHAASPVCLRQLTGQRCLFMLRWNAGGVEPEVGFLYHFPEGVHLPDQDGSVKLVHPGGWFTIPNGWNESAAERFFSGTRLERAAQQVKSFLDRHPKRRGKNSEMPELRNMAGFVAGFCASGLVNLALSLVVEFEERRSGTPSPTVS
jgi:hypothetical protein